MGLYNEGKIFKKKDLFEILINDCFSVKNSTCNFDTLESVNKKTVIFINLE